MPQSIDKKWYLYGVSMAVLVATTVEYAEELTLSSSGVAHSKLLSQLFFVNNYFKLTLFWSAEENALNLLQAFVMQSFKRLLRAGAGK